MLFGIIKKLKDYFWTSINAIKNFFNSLFSKSENKNSPAELGNKLADIQRHLKLDGLFVHTISKMDSYRKKLLNAHIEYGASNWRTWGHLNNCLKQVRKLIHDENGKPRLKLLMEGITFSLHTIFENNRYRENKLKGLPVTHISRDEGYDSLAKQLEALNKFDSKHKKLSNNMKVNLQIRDKVVVQAREKAKELRAEEGKPNASRSIVHASKLGAKQSQQKSTTPKKTSLKSKNATRSRLGIN